MWGKRWGKKKQKKKINETNVRTNKKHLKTSKNGVNILLTLGGAMDETGIIDRIYYAIIEKKDIGSFLFEKEGTNKRENESINDYKMQLKNNKTCVWQQSRVVLPFKLERGTAVITRRSTVEPKIHILGGADERGNAKAIHWEMSLTDVIAPNLLPSQFKVCKV